MCLEAKTDVANGVAGRQLAEHQVEKQVVATKLANVIVAVVLAHNAVELVSRDKIGNLGENIPTCVHNLAALGRKITSQFQIKKSKNAYNILYINYL